MNLLVVALADLAESAPRPQAGGEVVAGPAQRGRGGGPTEGAPGGDHPPLPEQSRAFLAAAGGDRFEVVYVVALTCGLRQGEILGLKWSDVDLAAKTMRVNRSFKPLLKSAGLPSIRFHDLRHTCATLLLAKGVHPKLVQALLGHASIGTTMDLYSHWAPAMGDQTAAAMEEALRENNKKVEETSDVA